MKNHVLLLMAWITSGLVLYGASTNDVVQPKWGAVTSNAQMLICLADGSQAVTTNQPVILQVRIKNVSTNEVFYMHLTGTIEMDPRISFVIISPSGREVSPKPPKAYAGSGATHQVQAGQIKEFSFNLSKLCRFDEVGTYTITAKKEIWPIEEAKIFNVVSEPLSLSVVSGNWEGGRTNSARIRW